MSVRKLLPIVLLLAAVSLRCSGSPSEPEGMVLVTQTTSTTTSTTTTTTSTTTTVIPPLAGGGASASPQSGVASATVFSFFASPPSGGVPPYLFTWNFGDGGEGGGNAPTHVYPNTGTFTATATATDSRGMTTQSSTTVSVRTVSGPWTVTFPPTAGLMPETIDLVQNQTAVTATINDRVNPMTGFASGTGTVSNPRSLTVSATFGAGTAAAFGVTFIGRIDDTLNGWTGTVTGYPNAGCPCTFTATRPTFPGDTFAPFSRSLRR